MNFACSQTQILNLRTKINFAKMLKISQKSGQTLNLLNFRIIIRILLRDKKGQRLQNQQKHILQQKNVVAGKNLPYGTFHVTGV